MIEKCPQDGVGAGGRAKCEDAESDRGNLEELIERGEVIPAEEVFNSPDPMPADESVTNADILAELRDDR